MKPNELAERLGTAHLHTRHEESFDKAFNALNQTLNNCASVASIIDGNRYGENESGSVRLFVPTHEQGEFVHRIDVNFEDPQGWRTHLGFVVRGSREKDVRVYAYTGSKGGADMILPDDERWEAIVGPIEQAVSVESTARVLSQTEH